MVQGKPWMIKLAQPHISEQAIDEVVAVLRSGNLVQGTYVEAFEQTLQAYLGVRHVVVVSSGTAALHLCLMALGIGPGDEVIVPAFTFPATANVVELCGAKPVFVDIGLDDYCVDVSKLKYALTAQTKVVMPVHEFGQAAEMDSIQRFAQEHGLFLVEDAACALGTEFAGKRVGSFGAAGCFSFHPRKAITTGEGGAIATDNDALADQLRSLRNHGITRVGGAMDFSAAGINYRMTDFQAALGCAQLRDFDQTIVQRIQIAKWYNVQFADIEAIRPPVSLPDRKHVYQTYHVLLDASVDRERLMAALKAAGIESNLGAQALQCTDYYKHKYKLAEDDFSHAARAYRSGLALPMGGHIDEQAVSFIAQQLNASIDRGGRP